MTDNHLLQQKNSNNDIDDESCKRIMKLDGYRGFDIDIVFFRVWRNIVTRNEILFHTRLYNIHMDRRIGFTLEELPTYKYRDYLNMVIVYSKKDEPPLLPNVIPYGVFDIEFNFRNQILQDSIPNTVTTVRFIGKAIKQNFIKGVLPDSITHLEFGFRSSFNQTFADGWLPNSLNSLLLNYEFRQDIMPNQLPKSLTELKFNSFIEYEGKIEPGSIPSIVPPLDYTFTWECEKETNNESNALPIPSTTKEYGFIQCIKEGDISHNAISIEFSDFFKGEIQGPLPASLKSLKLACSIDVSIGANSLYLSNLTSIDMGDYDRTFKPNLFPHSITSIKLSNVFQPIPEGYFYNYTNLKSLEFGRYNHVIPEKTLPPSLTLLDLGLGFDQIIPENSLPSSLLIFKLGHYHHQIKLNVLPQSLLTFELLYHRHPLDINVLPNSLSTLIIGSASYKLRVGQLPSSITSLSIYTEFPIPVGSLPCNLKVLHIQYQKFSQDLTMEGILPKSIQSIYLNNRIDKNYINNLDFDFFKKYIKFK